MPDKRTRWKPTYLWKLCKLIWEPLDLDPKARERGRNYLQKTPAIPLSLPCFLWKNPGPSSQALDRVSPSWLHRRSFPSIPIHTRGVHQRRLHRRPWSASAPPPLVSPVVVPGVPDRRPLFSPSTAPGVPSPPLESCRGASWSPKVPPEAETEGKRAKGKRAECRRQMPHWIAPATTASWVEFVHEKQHKMCVMYSVQLMCVWCNCDIVYICVW
jgi:hypothetical protein